MPIDRDKKFIFIHIPKVAGTSIEKALGIYGQHFKPSKDLAFGLFEHDGESYSLQHVSVGQLKKLGIINDKDVSEFYKFCFVRNPWDRAVSDFKWHKNIRKTDISFRSYLKKCKRIVESNSNDRKLTSSISHYVPQSWYVYNKDIIQEVDFIGKYENLQNDINKVLITLGINEVDLRNDNRGKPTPYFFYYFDIRNIFLVRNIYIDDIKNFNYHFFKSNTIKLFVKRINNKLCSSFKSK